MTLGGKPGSGTSDPNRSGATEPITLSDPDGAVTRVAPWSRWSREQVRAPGGEPALVTRLEQGQLWFAAGSRRSPWRHEVVVGPATVSTPAGRFHVTAESDGGATIDCLAGRTRVVAGLREPVVLGPDQTAAVSSDGSTLVVMDRSSRDVAGGSGDQWGGEPDQAPDSPAVAMSSGLDAENVPDGDTSEALVVPVGAGGGSGPGGDDGAAENGDGNGGGRRRNWIAEILAAAALLGVLIAAAIVFGQDSDSPDVTVPAQTPSTVGSSTSGPRPTQTLPATSSTIAVTSSTVTPSTITVPLTTGVPATAAGSLVGCRRASGGVLATVTVAHRSGGPGRFVVSVGLVDSSGAVFARGEAQTKLIDPGASASVGILIALAGEARGACQLLSVVPI